MRKASLNYIEDEEIDPYSKADCTSMHMGGVAHADAVVKCRTIDETVSQKIDSISKPVLNHTDEQTADNYLNFYNSLFADKEQ